MATENKTDYEKQAQDFLTKHGITYSVKFLDSRCPLWDDPKHIHGDRWEAKFTKENKQEYITDFWDSYQDKQDRELLKSGKMITGWDTTLVEGRRLKVLRAQGIRKPTDIHPTAYDVLAALTKYDPETFEDFCSEYGYDTDSIKARDMFNAVDHEWHKVNRFFGEWLDEMQEIQ